MLRSQKSVCAVLLLSLLWLACGDDTPSGVLPTGEIAGTVTFVGTQKPDGQIFVQLWRTWPPGSEATRAILIGNAAGTQQFVFADLALATYQAITVDWIVENDAAANRVLGVYWANSDSVGSAGTLPLPEQPLPIELTADRPRVENIKITADHSLVD